MRLGYSKAIADSGKQFVLTALGYEKTPERVKPERAVGKPIKGYESAVPLLWAKKEWG